MNCLLVSYTGLGVNSTEHAAAFGCGLVRLGCCVRLAVDVGGAWNGGFAFYRCDADGVLHACAPEAVQAPADVVHVWTPRAPIWRFLEAHRRLVKGPLVLHLEDDEVEVLRMFGAGHGGRTAFSRPELRALRLEDWSHPTLARALTESVDGITVLSPEQACDLPDSCPRAILTPPLAPHWWRPPTSHSPPSPDNGRATVVFAGGLHPGIAEDFLTLCRALRLVDPAGHKIRLVRSGPPADPALIQRAQDAAPGLQDIGLLSADDLHGLLASASVLVQPGTPSAFNRNRLPAKLAPYLASGTPVVMPSLYAWLGIRQGEHAMLLADGSAETLASAIRSVLSAPQEARAMGRRARDWARTYFDLKRCCEPLLAFYRSLPARPRFAWQSMRHPRLEAPLLLACQKAPPDRDLVRTVLEEIRTPVRRDGPMTVAQLFWPGRDDYHEKQSSVAPLASRRWTRLTFGPGKLLANRQPRLDPGDRPGTLEVTAIDYRSSDGRLLRRFRPPESPSPAVGRFATAAALPPIQRNVWRWLSYGNDPQLLLPSLPADAIVRIECWLRWTPTE